ncbi:MAG: DUF5652 family protein [Patescibacteria group bacterium]|nr:DUF5652 family protein [Patescibacteria group bacterium]
MNYFQIIAQQYAIPPVLLAVLLAWSIVWKLWALWRAARLGQKWWFIILFFINTVGILEIIYLFVVSKKMLKENNDEISSSN